MNVDVDEFCQLINCAEGKIRSVSCDNQKYVHKAKAKLDRGPVGQKMHFVLEAMVCAPLQCAPWSVHSKCNCEIVLSRTISGRQSKYFLHGPDSKFKHLFNYGKDTISKLIRFISGHAFMNVHNNIVKHGTKDLLATPATLSQGCAILWQLAPTVLDFICSSYPQHPDQSPCPCPNPYHPPGIPTLSTAYRVTNYRVHPILGQIWPESLQAEHRRIPRF